MELKQIITVAVVSWITYKILGLFDDNFDPASLEGKNILITGASSGIGEEMAYHYATYGANVFIVARREHLLKQVVEKCKSLGREGGHYGHLAADMNIEEDRIKLVQAAEAMFGDIDHLILNHAHMPPVSKWRGSAKDIQIFKDIMNVNVISFVQLTAEALPSLQRTAGSVTVLGSIAGRFPSALMREYVASKFALDGFYSSLRQEFVASRQNVSVTMCIIGVVWTEAAQGVWTKVLDRVPTPSEAIVSVLQSTAGTASDAAHAIISATTERKGELYYPTSQFLRLPCILRSMFPQLMETLNVMPLDDKY